MAILERAKKSLTKPAKEQTTETRDVRPVSSRAAELSRVLSSPRVSEKASVLAAKNVYVFNVPVSANKVQIGKAVEVLYAVNVIQVRTIRGAGKIVRRGRTAGARNRWKKALVTIKAGQKIDLYQGV